MTPLIERIQTTRLAAGLSILHTQLWLDAAYASVYSWCKGTVEPKDYKVPQIEERLKWLEQAIQAKELPLPLSMKPREKKEKLLALRNNYEQQSRSVRG